MRTIKIDQKEMKRALAIHSHLRNIYSAIVAPDGTIIKPTNMDQGKLLLASGSLRCLLFETHPHQPILLKFLKDNELDFTVNYLETNINLFFFSYFMPDEFHLSDALIKITVSQDGMNEFPIDTEKEILMSFKDPTPFLTLLERHDLWIPQDNREIDSEAPSVFFPTPGQFINITRRQRSLEQWTTSRIGYLKDRPIPRRRIIAYVANELGGVHYDSRHGLPTTEDDQLIRRLMTIFDWEYQSIMHTGFVVTALICLELFSIPEVRFLFKELESMIEQRQQRLLHKEH